MEPPAKRLRILRSVEVDETNPEYLAAKEKQRAKLKHKFESIFSKFEAIPDSMTDEIDMRTGEIVVDRGHMRRLDREYQRRHHKRKGLLDDLIADGAGVGDEEDEEDDGSNSGRDELAPSKSPEPPRHRRQGKESNAPATGQQGAQVDIPPPYTPSGNASQSRVASNAQLASSGVPTSAMNWMNMVQFPQTPAGQQAQNAFMTQITQAVQQAIVPIISNILTNTPMPQYGTPATQYTTPMAQQNIPVPPPQNADPLSTQAMSVERNDSLLKASDGVASSPLPTEPTSPRQRRFARCLYIPPRCSTLNPTYAGVHEKYAVEGGAKRDDVVETEKSPVVAPRRSARQRKEPATEPKHILQASGSRVFRASSISELRHLPTPSSTDRGETKDRDEREREAKNASLEEGLDAIIASRDHFDDDERDLLSLADSNDSDQDLPEYEHTEDAEMDDLDPDEIILPSVEIEVPIEEEGDEYEEEDPIAGEHAVITETVARTAIVSSSVKERIPRTQHTHLEANPYPKDGGLDVIGASSPSNARSTTKGSSQPLTKTISQTTMSSAVKKSTPRKQQIRFQVDSDSEDDGLDLVGASSPLKSTPKAKPSSKDLTCTLCNKHFQFPHTLHHHQTEFHQLEDDELTTANDPLTPVHIKHEPISPPSNLLLISSTKAPNTTMASTFQTPHLASQSFALNSTRSVGGTKDTPTTEMKKMSRSAFIRKIKQSWAREGRAGKGDGNRKRKSLLFGDASARKRSRVGDCDYHGGEDSEDELAG